MKRNILFMQRIFICLLTVMLLAASAVPVGAENGENIAISVTFQEKPIEFPEDVIQVNGNTMIPLMKFAEVIGAESSWSFVTQSVTLKYLETEIVLKEGEELALINGEEIAMPQPIQKHQGLLYAPVRFIAEAFGYSVEWIDETKTVNVFVSRENADIGNIYEVVSVYASEDDGNKPENVLDRNYNTRWSAESNGANITLELDDVHPVAYIGIACYVGNERMTTISVQVSKDGKNFNEVVTRKVTSLTLDMEAIDLGKTYDAKYIRVLGYGNTTNAWNSITELSVYGPYEDGSMPVATDGPGANATADLSILTDEQRQALADYDEKFYSRLDVWLANLYDVDEKGFYMTLSGRDDPEQHTAIEMSAWAQNILASKFSGWINLPEEVKQDWIDYYLDRQDPVSGYFIDKQGPVNDRETARNQAAALGRLNGWGVREYRYTHPSQLTGNEVAGDTQEKPDYVKSVKSYIDWVESWNWDTNSWTAGDQTHQSLKYLSYYLSDEEEKVYQQALIDWLAERQFDNGLWAPAINFNSISGAFKVGYIYKDLGMQYPNVDMVLESTEECFYVDVPTASMHIQNPMSILGFIAGYSESYKNKVAEVTMRVMPKVIEWTDMFYCPDGGFSMNYRKSQSNFGGIYGSHQLWEGDVDSALMFTNTRDSLYNLLGVKAPKLKLHDDFWEWIKGEKEVPSPYVDERYKNAVGSEMEKVSQNFNDLEPGALQGNEFGGNILTTVKGEIVQNKDKKNDNVLKVTKQKEESTNESFVVKISDATPVRYVPSYAKLDVIEFDIMVENCTAGNNFWILCGMPNGYTLNFGGNGNQTIGTRIDLTNVNYGGKFATLQPKRWYQIRIESYFGDDVSDYKTIVYLDGEQVAKNGFFTGYLTGGTPAAVAGELSVSWYKAGIGSVYLDNITTYSKMR